MKKIFKILIMSSLIYSSTLFAQSQNMMINMLQNMKLDKVQLVKMLDKLQQGGQISAEQAKKAKKEISGMSNSDLNALKGKAVKKLKSGEITPDKINEFKAKSGIK